MIGVTGGGERILVLWSNKIKPLYIHVACNLRKGLFVVENQKKVKWFRLIGS